MIAWCYKHKRVARWTPWGFICSARNHKVAPTIRKAA